MTSVEHHEPTTASIGGGHDTETCSDIPKSRKRATSEDTTVEQEAKRVRSPRPSEASLAPHHPYFECGQVRRPVGGMCSFPCIFGVGACA